MADYTFLGIKTYQQNFTGGGYTYTINIPFTIRHYPSLGKIGINPGNLYITAVNAAPAPVLTSNGRTSYYKCDASDDTIYWDGGTEDQDIQSYNYGANYMLHVDARGDQYPISDNDTWSVQQYKWCDDSGIWGGDLLPFQMSYVIEWYWDVVNTSYGLNKPSGTYTIDMTEFIMPATLTAVSTFTSTSNPQITYNNPMGDACQLYAAIAVNEIYNVVVPYREIGTNRTSYTFSLTDQERNAVLAAANETTETCWFLLKTVTNNGGYENVDYMVKTLTITNGEPVMEPTVVDVNTATVALTGDSSVLVKYHSNAECKTNAVPAQGATIAKTVIKNGNKTLEADGIFYGVESRDFIFTITDSRGLGLTMDKHPKMIEYIKLTCNAKFEKATVDGAINYTIAGNFYFETFGAVTNTLQVQVRYKEYGAEKFNAWVDVDKLTKHSKSYEATGAITGLDYQKTYVCEARAIDKLMTVNSAVANLKTVPVFDWGEEDFNFNVPVTIQGWDYGSNVVLWESSSGSQMVASHTAYLNNPLQNVPHGIVLVFSAASGDVSWSTHFVPKSIISRNQGGAQCFIMANNAAFATMGAKYLYIYDDMIVGHSSNNSSGTGASGITFDNSKFVLRAVLGV